MLTLSSTLAVADRSEASVRSPGLRTATAEAYVRLERVIEASQLGLRIPRGITFARESGVLLVTGTRRDGSAGLQTVSLLEQLKASMALPSGLPATSDIAYDPVRDRLVAAANADRLVAVPAAGGRLRPGVAGAASSIRGQTDTTAPSGIAVSATGQTLVLDASGTVTVSRAAVGSTAEVVVDQVSLAGAGEPLNGLAVASNGHIFSLGTESATLFEFASTGTLIASRDLVDLGVASPQDIAMAPSADTSDLATTQNVYLADAGGPNGSGAGIVELALVEPVLSPQVAGAATSSFPLANTINTGSGGTWDPDSPDPSGLAYIPAAAPGVPPSRTDRLVSADGEVDETTGAGWHNVNVWFAPRDGSAQSSTFNTAIKPPTAPVNDEPVGVAYDPVRDELYVCKDGSSGRIWVYRAATMAQVRSFTVYNAPYNNADAEGLAFHDGALYMVDAIDNDLVKVQPGGNGVVGTGGDDTVTNFDLQQYGQTEPEGLDVHPDTGNIWIVSNRVSGSGVPDPLIEVTPAGALVSTVSIAEANPHSAGGLAIAPPSNGSGGNNIYIADRGVDNNQVPGENDGKIYEFALGPEGPVPPTASFTWSQSPGTLDVTFTDTSTGSPEAWSWNFGDGTSGGPQHSAQNPTHTYAAPGTYTVELTATNAQGADVSDPQAVTVIDPTPPPNLLLNSSFEHDANGNGIPDNWGTKTKFKRWAFSPTHDGVWVGRHFASDNSGYSVFQDVPATAGAVYDMSGWINVPSTSDAFTFDVKLRWLNGTTTINTTTIGTVTAATGGWVERARGRTAPAGTTAVRVMMVLSSLNATIYVDDFSLTRR